jgi:hypothetical protein
MKNNIITTFIIILVIAGIAYGFSDVYKTKMDRSYDQMAHWTPENIAGDPEAYLFFCEKKIVEVMESLKANEIDNAQKRANIQQINESAKEKISLGDKALVQLKELYRAAETSKSWPLKFNNQEFDQEAAKKQIVSFFNEIEGQRSIANKCESALKKLEAYLIKIKDLNIKAQQQLMEVKTNLQLVKVEKNSQNLKDKLVNMRAAMEVIAGDSSKSGAPITLDELKADAEVRVDDSVFNKIMENK